MEAMRTLALLLLALGVARADYELPVAAETSFLAAHEWKLQGESLEAAGKRYKVDLFWLADRIDSNLICCGAYDVEMRKYLGRLDRKLPVMVELVALKKGETPFVAGVWQLDAGRIGKHLALVAKLEGPAERKAGEPVRLRIELENRSAVPYKVVLPNDGSESGWREPHVFFSAKLDGRELKPKPILRCGMFAEDWKRDIVDLKPGEKIRIDDRYMPVDISIDLTKPGKLELRAHYAYKGGQPDPGAMGKTPAFELASDPVTVALR